MTILQYIEKAIDGGWEGLEFHDVIKHDTFRPVDIYTRIWGESELGESHGMTVAEVLLNPLAWQAVGKVEGWDTTEQSHGNWDDLRTITYTNVPTWRYNMHRMIDALASGQTIEQFLASLT